MIVWPSLWDCQGNNISDASSKIKASTVDTGESRSGLAESIRNEVIRSGRVFHSESSAKKRAAMTSPSTALVKSERPVYLAEFDAFCCSRSNTLQRPAIAPVSYEFSPVVNDNESAKGNATCGGEGSAEKNAEFAGPIIRSRPMALMMI